MKDYKLLIDGELVAGDGEIDVINPADETVYSPCPVASPAQLDRAMAAARSAYGDWSRTPIEERRALLLRVADVIAKNVDSVALVLTGEQGKPLEQAKLEVSFAEMFCRAIADMDLSGHVLHEDESQRVELKRLSIGVVAAITPWNYPFLIAVYKLTPALLAGNTLVIKPAPTTPLTTLMLGELVKDILPPGVFNVITDDNDLGPLLTTHPEVDKISFTGSTVTGKAIMQSAAKSLKRVTLELGGNDAAIVLDDVDPKQVAPGIFGAAFLNSGQVCIALKRLYVHEDIYDELCDAIAMLAKQAVVGNGMNPDSQYGPVQNKTQFEKVCNFIKEAKKDGTVISGGDVPSEAGYMVPLTVVRDIEDGSSVVDEEPFGPVLPIIRYRNLDDVIESANNSPYGLGGSVWSSDLGRAQEVAGRIDSGTVWINQHCAFGPNIPMPTAKDSGIGIEWGQLGLEEFTQLKVININTEPTG